MGAGNTAAGAGAMPPADAGMPCPGLPRGTDDEPVFYAPWQAQVFAMTVQLHAGGLFTWPEWAAALSARLASAVAQAPVDAERAATAYYQQWLAALEDLVQAKRASSADELLRYARAWDRAAHRTPHGQPIELRDEDFAS